MGNKRAYTVVAVDDEPDFGDPPRRWTRVAAMAGAWTLILLGGAWVAPGFAAGGGESETDARDQAATDEINAASRYLRFGSDGDDRADSVLCEDAAPTMTVDDLVALRAAYEDDLGSYPQVEVETAEPRGTPEGFAVDASLSYIAGNTIRDEQFTITVLASGAGYCVSQAVWTSEEGHDDAVADRDVDLLRFVVFDRDVAAAEAVRCDEYTGPSPQDLLEAVEAWEAEHGAGGLSYAAPTGAGAAPNDGVATSFAYDVVLDGDGIEETFAFTVTVIGDCVSAVSGGDVLLDPAD